MDHNLDDLREALRRCSSRATSSTKTCSDRSTRCRQQGKLDELIDKLIERMEQENYISYSTEQPEPDADVAK